MDLIFARADKTDIGILHDYEFDLAYGKDENNFTLELALKNHCCQDDYLVYMIDPQFKREDPTEYGGIIDSIKVDTEKATVIYSGRTWHGILSEKVIEPEDGQNYKVVTGNANDVLRELIEDLDLDALFTVADGLSEVEIDSYQFERYVDGYTGIVDMLADNGAKLKVVYDKKMVVLSADWLVDYSMDDEWDSSQVDFKIEKRVNPVNHLVCLGQGSLRDRFKIHLFTDENGGIQPYATKDVPLEDSDYILDKRSQILFDSYEIAEAYDYPSAGIKENYIRLSVQPADWSTNYGNYFIYSNNDFKNVEATKRDVLNVLSSQPSDWATNFGKYFTADGKAVQGTATESYTKLTKQPKDWNENWSSYYVHFWDGTKYVWRTVDSKSVTTYKTQTRKPTDWNTNFSRYYQHKVITETVKDANGKVVRENGKIKKKKRIGKGYESVKKVKKGKKEVAPTWKPKKFFTKYSSSKAPSYTKSMNGLDKYQLNRTSVAPAWKAGTYYSKTSVTVIPVFTPNKYYRKAIDDYADLVAYGIKKLNEINTEGDSIDIDLNLFGEYDIGDIVGARENTTGIEVWQPITKKIISINRNGRTINYRIGDIKI